MRDIRIDGNWLLRRMAEEQERAKQHYNQQKKDDSIIEETVFPKETNVKNYNLSEKERTRKINRLERRFLKEKDSILDLADTIETSGTSYYEDDTLLNLYNSLTTKDKRLCLLANGYANLFGDEEHCHEAYEEYCDLSEEVISKLNEEIKERGLKVASFYDPQNERVLELDTIFSHMAGEAKRTEQIFKTKKIEKLKTEDLKNELKYFKGDQKEGINGELRDMFNLNREYEKLTGKRNLDYSQYVKSISDIVQRLEQEKTIREQILRDFDGGGW